MSTRVSLAALATFAFGCASAGGGSDLPPVTVYASTDEVPCEYEVIETVRGSSSTRARSPADYRRIRADVLGQAGADIGADAVIAPEIDEVGTVRRVDGAVTVGGDGRAVQRRGGQPPPPAPLLRFSGEAIRFIPDTCSAPR